MIHQCCLYDSDAAFLAMALPFIRGGLNDGVKVMVAVSAANTALLRTSLGRDAHRVALADTHALGRRPPDRLNSLDHLWRTCTDPGGRRMRLLAEAPWADRSESEVNALTHMESALTSLFADFDMWLMCAYDTRRLPPRITADSLLTHPELVEGTRTRASDSYIAPGAFARVGLLSVPRTVPTGLEGGAFSPADLVRVCEDAQGYARQRSASEERCADFASAVREVAANVVLHGAGRGSAWFWTEQDEMICEIGDPAEGAPLSRMAGAPPPLGGRPRGLWRVRQLCDRVHIDRSAGRTTVRMHMLIKG